MKLHDLIYGETPDGFILTADDESITEYKEMPGELFTEEARTFIDCLIARIDDEVERRTAPLCEVCGIGGVLESYTIDGANGIQILAVHKNGSVCAKTLEREASPATKALLATIRENEELSRGPTRSSRRSS